MKHQRINSVWAALLLGMPAVMLTTSCEDMLDKPSFTTDDTDYVFENLDKAELYVKGCYRGLIHEEQYRQMNSGETITGVCEESLSGSKWMIGNYDYDPILPAALYTTYNESYRIIEMCNVGLKYISKFDDSDARRNQFMAELYTVRAYCYLNLIRFFGDVPYQFTPLEDCDPDDDATWYPARHDRDDIYDRIIGEIQEHIEYLPWFAESDYGSAPERITRQGAYGILARICLNAAGYSLRWDLNTLSESTLEMATRSDQARVRELYQIADDALATVIGKGCNSLVQADASMDGFQKLFYNYCQRNYGVSSQEMMFQIAEYGTTTNSTFGVYNGQPGSIGGLYGQRKALQHKLPTYYLSFEDGDVRRDVSCCDYSIVYKTTNSIDEEWSNVGTTYSCITSGKFRIQWAVEPAAASQRNIDIPLLRYADILLMYAETQNYLHGGPTSAAISALQQVRDRAGVGHLSVPTGQDEFLEVILQERKWEFADEFMLRYDLIRTNKLGEHLASSKQDLMDLADRTGKYADVAKYRLYRYEQNAQVYGDTFLTVPYIDLTDEDEIALISTAPNTTAKLNTMKANIATILANHGITDSNLWYPVNMMQSWGSTYNKNCRLTAGFVSMSALQLGASTYLSPTSCDENNGNYPEWISQIYYGYQANHVELFPFACKSAGHPMVDNPNLTQLPGYPSAE